MQRASLKIGVGDKLETVLLRLSDKTFAVSVVDCAEASFRVEIAEQLRGVLMEVRERVSTHAENGQWMWLLGAGDTHDGAIALRLEQVNLRAATSGRRLLLNIYTVEGSYECLGFEMDDESIERLLETLNSLVLSPHPHP
jgi:hypothetical protein